MSNRLRLYGPDGRIIGPRTVKNPLTGRTLPCCWGDCWEPGDRRYKIVTPHPDKPGHTQTRIYCSPGHRAQDAEEKGLTRFL